jgi:hypothetical protein
MHQSINPTAVAELWYRSIDSSYNFFTKIHIQNTKMLAYMNGITALSASGIRVTGTTAGALVKTQQNHDIDVAAGSLSSVVLNHFFRRHFEKKSATVITQHDLGQKDGDIAAEFGTATDVVSVEAALDSITFKQLQDDPSIADTPTYRAIHGIPLVESEEPAEAGTEDKTAGGEEVKDNGAIKKAPKRKEMRIKRFGGYTQIDIDQLIDPGEIVPKTSVESDSEDEEDEDDDLASAEDLGAEGEVPQTKKLAVPNRFYFSFVCPKFLRDIYVTKLKELLGADIRFACKDNEVCCSNLVNCLRFPPLICHVPGLAEKMAIDPAYETQLDESLDRDSAKLAEQRKQLSFKVAGLPAAEKKLVLSEHYAAQANAVTSDPAQLKSRIMPSVIRAIDMSNYKRLNDACCLPEAAKLLSVLKDEHTLGGKKGVGRQLTDLAREEKNAGQLVYKDLKTFIDTLKADYADSADFSNPEAVFVLVKKYLPYFHQGPGGLIFKPVV